MNWFDGQNVKAVPEARGLHSLAHSRDTLRGRTVPIALPAAVSISSPGKAELPWHSTQSYDDACNDGAE
jgi:hypothetical protein